MRRTLAAALAVAVLLTAGAGAAERSSKARRDFARQHPCPATGQKRGPCPGYVIDHIVPLCKHGPDRPDNMQWQTIAEGKEKDRWECKVTKPRG